MALASLAMSAASTGMNTVGAYYDALGQKRNLRFQARMNEINADIADGNARVALSRGERQEQASRLETSEIKAKQEVGYAASGVDLSSQSVTAAQTTTDVFGEVDANTIKANALREAWGHRIDATGLRSQAEINRASASGINPLLSAGSTLLTGVANVSSQYDSLKSSGALQRSSKTWSKRKSQAGEFFGQLRGL